MPASLGLEQPAMRFAQHLDEYAARRIHERVCHRAGGARPAANWLVRKKYCVLSKKRMQHNMHINQVCLCACERVPSVSVCLWNET